jgi:hypothetical protein
MRRAMRFVSLWLALGVVGPLCAQTVPAQTQPGIRELTVEQKVRSNILNQRIGGHSVSDLNMPRPYIDRLTDRIIRSSYEQRYRIVVDDSQSVPATTQAVSHSGVDTSRSRSYWVELGLGMIVLACGVMLMIRWRRGAAT